ncbi:MAG TPA: nuclear transport factor 2 family protein [Gammaproteobacteria bacterium]|nr:nuclear transport factor 2 family protein [Gammaproteobacteria bacterium]
MGAADHLGVYAEGWTKGDAETILRAVTDDFTFDDPNAGTIPKSNLADYLSGMKETVRSLCGGSLPDPFMELSEVVTQEGGGVLTAWCWWAIPGTGIKGSGLIKVGSGGVRSEVITYYTRLPG